jgi:phage tail protein X
MGCGIVYNLLFGIVQVSSVFKFRFLCKHCYFSAFILFSMIWKTNVGLKKALRTSERSDINRQNWMVEEGDNLASSWKVAKNLSHSSKFSSYITFWLPGPTVELPARNTKAVLGVNAAILPQMNTGIDMWKPVLPSKHRFDTLDAICWQKCCTDWLITNQSFCGSYNASTTSKSNRFVAYQGLKHLACYYVEPCLGTLSSCS